MASTATNKQPLLIDRVFHAVVDLAKKTVQPNSGINLAGSNSAALFIDCTGNDGALIEDIYCYSRGVDYVINLYINSASDYLRPESGLFIGSFNCGTEYGARVEYQGMPRILAPSPKVGTEANFRALYVPKGRAIWAAVEQANANDTAEQAPIIGAQGGLY